MKEIILLIFLFILLSIPTLIIVLFSIHRKRYNFVKQNSFAINQLTQINAHYKFHKIENYNMSHSYDNENFYDTVSTEDYMVYQLIYLQGEIKKAINEARENKDLFSKYNAEIKNAKIPLGNFGVPLSKTKEKRYSKIEQKIYKNYLQNPVTNFSITVYLKLEKMNGQFVTA